MHTSLEPPWHLDGSGFSKFIAKNWVFGRNYVEAWPQWEGPGYKIDPWSFDKEPEDDGFQKESRFPGENDFRFHVKLGGHIAASCFFCCFGYDHFHKISSWGAPYGFSSVRFATRMNTACCRARAAPAAEKVVIPWVVATQTQDPAWHEEVGLPNGTPAFMARNKPGNITR